MSPTTLRFEAETDKLSRPPRQNSCPWIQPPTPSTTSRPGLFKLVTGSRATGAVTRQITHEIGRWAVARGWHPRPEARVLLTDGAQERVGYIDLVVMRGGDGPDLAIEIDSTDKQWSLAKLRHVVAAGMRGVWIRWGDEAWAGIYDEVDVIQLPEMRRSAPRLNGRGQLSLWPK